MSHPPPLLSRRRCVHAGLLAGALLAVKRAAQAQVPAEASRAAPVAAAAAPGTAQAQAVVDEVWLDAQRSRQLPVLQRWPARPNGAWIVYSHGLGGSREGGDAWGQAWAAAGFVVFHVQHPGSDIALWKEGVPAVRAAASLEQLLARVADVRFAIDEVQRRIATRAENLPYVALEAARVGLVGHSFGARTTQVVAGESGSAAGQAGAATAPPLADARARAFMAFSPSAGAQAASGALPAAAALRFAAVTRPFLCATGSLDGDPLSGRSSGLPRREVYEALPPGARAELWLEGADHNTFGGNVRQRITARSGLLRREAQALALEAQHHALLAGISTLWWRAHLLGDEAAAQALQRPAGLAAGDAWRSG